MQGSNSGGLGMGSVRVGVDADGGEKASVHSHTYLTNARARRHAPKTLSVTLLLPFFILWLHSLGRPSVRPLGFWCGGWSPTAPTVAVETNPRAANPGGKHAQHTCWV